MNHSSQIRMTNDEIRRNDKIRMTKPANAPLRVVRHSGFGFLSSFVIQRLMQFRFMVPMHAQKRMAALSMNSKVGQAKPTADRASRSRWRARGAGGTPALRWARSDSSSQCTLEKRRDYP